MVDPMPTVAIIGTRGYPSYYGGFETAVRRLAPFLVKAGWQVLVYSRPGEIVEDDPHRDTRVRTITTRGLNSNALSTLTFGLTSVLSACRLRPDVALVMNVANGFWLPLLRLRGIPVVVNVDGIEWERAKWGRFARWLFKKGAKLTARWSNTLIFDAHAIADYWRREFKRDGTFIPYGGEVMDDLPHPSHITRRPFVLLVARFVPENTVAEFLQAAVNVSDELDVVIVGAGSPTNPLQRQAQDLARDHERVHHLGHVRDDALLHALWQHAAVYFHGHSVGGTNPALVQAMALGSHAVARDTVYNREVLGDLARYVPADAASISRAINEEFRAQSACKEELQRRAASTYSWDSVCEAYESVLRGCVQESASPSLK